MGARRYGGAVGGLTRPSEFVALEDTPSSYAGQSGKSVAVNAGEDSLEFAAAGGISEGDYTSWTHKWTNDYPDGLFTMSYTTFLIDERSDVLNLAWRDNLLGKYRFGIYNLSDFSVVFQSPSASSYFYNAPSADNARWTALGNVCLGETGISRSLQSYVLLLGSDHHTIEAWRGGSSPVWSHSIRDEEAGDSARFGEMSLTGKWILVSTASNKKLILYEGT